MSINVVKASGDIEPLDLNKVRRACMRTGASEVIAKKVLRDVQNSLFDGISTKKIYRTVCKLLKQYSYYSEARFRLKESMMNMGPSGFPFETYVNEILKNYGYKTTQNVVLKGVCANHEIDIVAEENSSNSKRFLIECKYHNAFGIYTGLKQVLYTYARLLDLQEGYNKGICERIDGAWLVTNTKISREAVKYGECKGLNLLGWRYPPDKGLEWMIEQKNLFPVTVLGFIGKKSLEKFSKAGVMLVKDLESLNAKNLSEMTGISQSEIRVIKDKILDFNRSP